MPEALQAGKTNPYLEYVSVSMRKRLCPLHGPLEGAMKLSWSNLLEICPLGCSEKLFMRHCATKLEVCGNAGSQPLSVADHLALLD